VCGFPAILSAGFPQSCLQVSRTLESLTDWSVNLSQVVAEGACSGFICIPGVAIALDSHRFSIALDSQLPSILIDSQLPSILNCPREGFACRAARLHGI
jgi:hypothetical protein